MSLSIDTPVALTAQTAVRRVGDAVHLANLKSGQHFSADGSGARILELLEQDEPLAAIAHRIADEYEVEADQAAADLLGFVEVLMSVGIVIPVPPAEV